MGKHDLIFYWTNYLWNIQRLSLSFYSGDAYSLWKKYCPKAFMIHSISISRICPVIDIKLTLYLQRLSFQHPFVGYLIPNAPSFSLYWSKPSFKKSFLNGFSMAVTVLNQLEQRMVIYEVLWEIRNDDTFQKPRQPFWFGQIQFKQCSNV
jgi:hypothetical protein